MDEFVEISGISQAWVRNVPHFIDKRGYFCEEFRTSDCPSIVPEFIQDSLSFSRKNVLRGMHLQIDQWQLVTLVKGELVDTLIDLRVSSPSFLKSVSLNLSESSANQLLVAPGIAHGYGVLSDEALIHYKSSVYYGDTPQYGLNWSTPELKSHWPVRSWVLSDRDSNFPFLNELIEDRIFSASIRQSN